MKSNRHSFDYSLLFFNVACVIIIASYAVSANFMSSSEDNAATAEHTVMSEGESLSPHPGAAHRSHRALSVCRRFIQSEIMHTHNVRWHEISWISQSTAYKGGGRFEVQGTVGGAAKIHYECQAMHYNDSSWAILNHNLDSDLQ